MSNPTVHPTQDLPQVGYPIDPWAELAKIEDQCAKKIEEILEDPRLPREEQGDVRVMLVATCDLATRYRALARM